MVSCVEIKIQGVLFAKKFLRFDKYTLWSVQKEMLYEHYVTFWKYVAQKLGN